MYERNAIVLERYFNQMFGYNMKNNLKTNFQDYCELVECLEKYKNISDEEETIMQEYDLIANQIREIQKTQETLDKKNNKYQEERANIIQNIDENAETIQKKLTNVNNNIQNIDEEIKKNAQQFVEVITEFNEKSKVRTICERERRNIESQYNKKLNQTLDNYKDIDINYEKKAKQFIEAETDDIEKELKQKIEKNGEKEKIPFNIKVMTKAITLSIYIQKRETEILTSIYEKTNKLFTEIKNNTIKSDKHQKNIKDSKSKLEFIGAIKEYLIQFLDNERLTAVNGEEEHSKLMEEACNNLEEDLEQINNLYTLLLKEITKKITKKSYSELYNIDYLKTLETKSKKFDSEIKKLNLPVTIINPNYWRIEGMKKIYEVFYKCVTEEYERDLSEYIPFEKIEEQEDFEQEDMEEIAEVESQEQETKKTTKRTRKKQTKNKEPEDDDSDDNNESDAKTEIDKKIDMILGIEDDDWEDSQSDDEDDEWDDEEDLDDDWDDEEEFEEEPDDQWEEEEDSDNDWEDEEEPDDDWDDEEEFEEELDDEWGDEDAEDEDEEDWRNEEFFGEGKDNDIDDEEDDFDDDWDDDFEIDEEDDEDDEEDDDDEEEKDEIQNKKNHSIKPKKNNKPENSWENEFIRMDKMDLTQKKKGFFDKFKK